MTTTKLSGTKTHQNLKDAFAGESQASRRYLYFAKVADIEGYPDVAGLFKDTADGETGHAHGHLDFLKQVGDPATGKVVRPRVFWFLGRGWVPRGGASRSAIRPRTCSPPCTAKPTNTKPCIR